MNNSQQNCAVLSLSFWPSRIFLLKEGFPTSGNDKSMRNDPLNSMKCDKEFLD